MLLPTCLALTSLLAPAIAQDGNASPADQQSSSNVVSYLESCQENLYDIQAAGLQSLSFSIPVRAPNPASGDPMELGHVAVAWATDSEPAFEVSVSEQLPARMDGMAEMIQMQLEGHGQQILGYIRSNLFEGLLQTHIASLDGSEDGLLKVHFEPGGTAGNAPAVDWFFDEDTPVKYAFTMTNGVMTVESSFTYSWRPVSASNESLVLDKLTVKQNAGAMKAESVNEFQYQEIDGLLILSGYVEHTTPPGGEPITNEVIFENIQVKTADHPAEG